MPQPKRLGFKKGAMHADEAGYIKANYQKKTAEDIGNHLNRSEEVILRYIRNYVKPEKPITEVEREATARIVAQQELRTSEAWKALKEEFDEGELKYFLESYVEKMAQMKDNVLATEETQIFQAVKYEILMSRNLREQKRARDDIRTIEKRQAEMIRVHGDPSLMTDSQRDFLLALETQLTGLRSSSQMRTGEHVKLGEKHIELMKALKSTRDQRIRQIDDLSKHGYLSVIKKLSERDEQEKQGRHNALVKLAGQKEYQRLGRPRRYEDGNFDNPILSADTVDLDPEEAIDASSVKEESEEGGDSGYDARQTGD